MDVTRRWLLWLPAATFVALVALVGYALWRPADTTIRSTMIGHTVPPLTLPPMIAGKPGLDSAALEGRGGHLVNVFASWCVPCQAEAGELMKLKAMSVPIIGVAVRDTPAATGAFLAANGDPFQAIADDQQSRFQLAIGSSGVPESFVVGPSGRIVLQHIGAIRPEDVDAIAAAVNAAR